MDILKAFVLDGKEHNITIIWDNGKPLFRASEIGNILEIKNIRSTISDFDDDERCVDIIYTTFGPRENIFLTECGLYKLLMISRKPIAKPFQKWVYKVIESIRETGKYELQLKIEETKEVIQAETKEQIELALKQVNENSKREIEKADHNALVEAFRDRYLVYFAKLCEKDDGKWLIKIGSTKEIQNISLTLLKEFGSFSVLKILECPRNEAFEKFLHHHREIEKFKYKDKHFNSIETFLVNEKEFDEIIRIAIHNKHKFSSIVEHEHIIELETLKLKQMEAKITESQLQKEIQGLKLDELTKITSEDNDYIDPVILLGDFRKHTQSRGNKIQRYSPDGKTLIKTYDSFAYAMRDKDVGESTSRGCIKNAIENKLVYKDSRWAELDRNMQDETIQEIGETVESKTVKLGYVAMLNMNKDKIVNVFCDQKAAAEDRKFSSGGAVSNAIKRESVSGGHYFKMWDDCSQELKDEFLLDNELPEKRIPINGKKIEQLHPITNQVIKVFTSFEDVIKDFRVSRQTLKSACNFDIICKGYKWKLK